MKKLFTLGSLFISSLCFSQASTHLVISQIYGGGGNASASYANDFVELFNPTPADIVVTGYSVQYASSAGTTWTSVNLTGTVLSHHFYLIKLASNAAVGAALPTADATGTANLSAAAGKIVLSNSTTLYNPTSCPTGATVVDFIGYGSAANCSETVIANNASNNTASVSRKDVFIDTDNNAGDFMVTNPATPRNSSTAPLPVILQQFSTGKAGTSNKIHWLVNCLSTSVTFDIQRGTTAANFNTIYSQKETQERCALPFDYTDNQPNAGANYYRLKIIDIDGSVSYSSVSLLVNKITGIGTIHLMPTLVTSQATISFVSASAGTANWLVTDIHGRVIKKITGAVQSGENIITIDVNNLPNGQYQVTGLTNEGKTNVVQMVKL